MVGTLLEEWTHARLFTVTADRTALLPQFLDFTTGFGHTRACQGSRR